jgi:hypothetical protein
LYDMLLAVNAFSIMIEAASSPQELEDLRRLYLSEERNRFLQITSILAQP